MNKKKGLSRQFTRDLKIASELAPSEYEIVPQKLPGMDLDDPTEIVKRHKEFLKMQEKKVVKFPKPSQPVKIAEPVNLETPNKEKINLIVNKLNFLKRNREEREKKEKTTSVEKKESEVKNETEEGRFSGKFKPVSLSTESVKEKPETAENFSEKCKETTANKGFLKKFFFKPKKQEQESGPAKNSEPQKQKPEPIPEEKPGSKKQEIQSKLDGKDEDSS